MTDFKLPEEFVKNSRLMHVQSVRTATSIGLLVMQFNRFEHDLGEFLAVFMKRESQEQYFENIAIMTAALSFGQKLDLLSALYLNRYEDQSAQCDIFKRIISQLSKFEEYRNALIHSRWGTHTFGDSEFKRFKPNIKGRKGLRQVAALADWRQIRMMCKEMQEFNCTEMFEVYRGCVKYEAMSVETIDKLSERLTARSNGPLQAAAA
ncbi:hypothetical protein [Pelomonas sp. BJYL3]|uniref:hypothetical protein n=1 Tax=Pelomonas sp. BJYL3 TaxID=2976697 RepID=UPI0022B44D6C|nr:hypothetical protein [Pelomonas sp. BJYL3]